MLSATTSRHPGAPGETCDPRAAARQDSRMAILPPRPLRLDARSLASRKLRKTALALFVAAVGGAFSVGAVFLTRQLLAERALWERGAGGRVVRLSGKLEKWQKLGLTFFYDYALEVSWADDQGRVHQGKSSFEWMFKGVPESDVPELRYDPAAPDRFVLSWAAQGGLPRDGMAILCAALGTLMTLGTIAMIRGERRWLELLRICAEDGDEILGRVEKAWQHKGVHYVRYRLPDDGRVRKHEGEQPLILLSGGVQHVLALRSPRAPDSPFVVAADLRCFELSEDERARVGKALGTA